MKKNIFKYIWDSIRAPFRKKTYFYLLAKLSDKKIIKNNAQKINSFLLSSHGKRAVKDVSELIYKLEKDTSNKLVYFFQHTFFDATGENYHSGGAERYMLDLFKLLSEMGYTAVLIQEGIKSAKPWCKEKNGMQVIGVNVSKRDFLPAISALPEPKLAIYSCHVDWHFFTYKNSLLLSHGITWDATSQDVDPRRKYDILKVFKKVVSVDTNVLSWFRTTFSASLDENPIEMHFVPNYVDLTEFTSSKNKISDKVKILFPRRCVGNRGFWLLANNVERILDKYKNAEIHFVGYAHLPDVVDKIQLLLDKYPHQVFHSVVDADDMYKVYQDVDITLIPTVYAEGTSLSCLEALACGNVVISTNIGGLPNLVFNGYNGLLINPDEHEMLNALDKVLASKDLREMLSKNALSVVKAFDKKIWIERWKEILYNFL